MSGSDRGSTAVLDGGFIDGRSLPTGLPTDRVPQYRCARRNPYEFIGFGAMDVTKPYKSIWFGDSHGP